MPLAFSSGEAFQFDWSEDWAVICGERTKLQVAHFKLSYNRAFILGAYPQQTHEMLFAAHNTLPCYGRRAAARHLRQYANLGRQDRPLPTGGFTTQRCRLKAGMFALFYDWWNIFVRLADPNLHREAIISRPLFLSAIAKDGQALAARCSL